MDGIIHIFPGRHLLNVSVTLQILIWTTNQLTRIYRKKVSNEWNIDTSLTNHVDHITRIDLTHATLPSQLPKEIMKNTAHFSK
jgi:hypothetical protein